MTATKFTVARVASEAARAVPGVAGLYGGVLGEFSTYGGGERIQGVRVRWGDSTETEEVEVRVALDFGHLVGSLPDTVQGLGVRVQEAVYDAVAVVADPPLHVRVRVADIVRPGEVEG